MPSSRSRTGGLLSFLSFFGPCRVILARGSGVGVFGPSPVFFQGKNAVYSRLAKQARARGHAARGVTETQAPRASSRCHLPSKPKEPPAIARHSAITGNKPANQEGQLVAVDNRADLLRTLLFLGALGLYAMDIAPLIACFSFDKHINEGNGQRGPCAIAPALIAAANSSCLRSATGLSASPRQ